MTDATPARHPHINDCIHFDYCKLEQRRQGFCDTNFYCTHYHKPKDCATHTSPGTAASPICDRCKTDQEPFCIGCERLKPHDAQVAKAAREQVLQQVIDYCKKEAKENPDDEAWYDSTMENVADYCESLRAQQEPHHEQSKGRCTDNT